MKKQRWIIKIGSALLTQNGAGLDEVRIKDWCAQMANLRSNDIEVILVSSGAVAVGMSHLDWKTRPEQMAKLQAAAAIGQTKLVQFYEQCFNAHQMHSAQILLTHDDLANRTRYLNAKAALEALLELGIIPIINENDTVVTDEIRFGDNDTLGALVANLMVADRLIILTDQLGLFNKDPRSNPDATLIEQANASDSDIALMATGGGALGRGGMITKIRAAKLAARSGANTNIASGMEKDVIVRLFKGEKLGTLLLADQEPINARKQWIAGHLQTKGTLMVDSGAHQAIKNHKSVLPVGIISSSGSFLRGEVVSLADESGKIFGRGLSNYSATDLQQIIGQPTAQISKTLGYACDNEIIHCDNLVYL
ncbi:glutamate 5-kinase [Marinicellulosiphila megalodicopiae]|uniref:glutamate 5-kinase n=1 Tax=Marinicellulosiphila megalodicopiae TaxID=2724896 RepID=UPI003BAEA2D9